MAPRVHVGLLLLVGEALAAGQDAPVEAAVGPNGVVMLQMPRPKTRRSDYKKEPGEAKAAPGALVEESAQGQLSADEAREAEERRAASQAAGSEGAVVVACKGKDVVIGYCWTTYYAAAICILSVLILGLFFDGYNQRKTQDQLRSKIRALRSKIRHEKKVIRRDEQDIRNLALALKDDERSLYEKILARGAVSIDLNGKCIVLKRSINFVPVSYGKLPVAEFDNMTEARIVLADVAELLMIFRSAVLLIEGHTQTPIDEIDDFAHELAYARAELVKLELMAQGIEEYRLDAVGLPGAIGNNEHRVVMNFISV